MAGLASLTRRTGHEDHPSPGAHHTRHRARGEEHSIEIDGHRITPAITIQRIHIDPHRWPDTRVTNNDVNATELVVTARDERLIGLRTSEVAAKCERIHALCDEISYHRIRFVRTTPVRDAHIGTGAC